MKKRDVLTLLEDSGAILRNGHFVLTSGKHSDTYINKDAAYLLPNVASAIGELFAEQAIEYPVDVVAAPALGGIILSQWTAYHLGLIRKRPIYSVYTEKTLDKNQVFTRRYDTIIKNKHVLVLEDLTTTGNSVRKVVASVENAGGNVKAIGVMVNRNPSDVNVSVFSAPFFALATVPVDTYNAATCPLCQKRVPVHTSVGHGKKFLESIKK